MEVKGNDVTLIKIYMGDKDIPELAYNKKIIPFVNNQIRKLQFWPLHPNSAIYSLPKLLVKIGTMC